MELLLAFDDDISLLRTESGFGVTMTLIGNTDTHWFT
jgi:hypothetical protein